MANNPENQSTPPVVEIKIRPEQIALAGLIILALVCGALLVVQLRHVLVFFFVALVIAATLQRPVTIMRQWGIPQGPALILIYLAIFSVIVGIIVLVIPVLATQIGALLESLPKMYSE